MDTINLGCLIAERQFDWAERDIYPATVGPFEPSCFRRSSADFGDNVAGEDEMGSPTVDLGLHSHPFGAPDCGDCDR